MHETVSFIPLKTYIFYWVPTEMRSEKGQFNLARNSGDRKENTLSRLVWDRLLEIEEWVHREEGGQ